MQKITKKSAFEIEPIKMLLFVVIFITLSLWIVFVFIVPNMIEYKKVSQEYESYKIEKKKMDGNIAQKQHSLDLAKKDSSLVVAQFSDEFTKKDFELYTNYFFKDLSFSKTQKIKLENGFYYDEFNVTGNMKTPQDFYKFLDGFKIFRSAVVVTEPINMQLQGHKIKTDFRVRFYRKD